MEPRNLTLLTDLYELTMMQGYFREKDANETVIFDAFYRTNPDGNAFSICAGLEQVIDYVKNLHFDDADIEYLRGLGIFDEDFLEYLHNFKFSGDIYAIPEGTVVFPREPLVKVIAPIMEAQLVETAILNIINHQSLIATKTSRIVFAARGDGIMEFGLRRAQGADAGTYGARAAMIAGCIGTSNVLAGKLFDVPVKGTHAHSWIMSFPDELTAFRAYAKLYPSACILLADTYDTLGSGVPNAIRVFQEMREARSLAYTAFATFTEMRDKDDPYIFYAFIATQNDKMRQAVEAFDGTLLFVSHDRYFVERFATRVLYLENGRLIDFIGSYSAFLDWRAKGGGALPAAEAAPVPKKKKAAVPTLDDVPKPPEKPKRTGGTKNLQKQLSTLEREISQLETQSGDLEQQMADAASDSSRLLELMTEKETCDEKLAAKMDEWEAVAAELEAMQ